MLPLLLQEWQKSRRRDLRVNKWRAVCHTILPSDQRLGGNLNSEKLVCSLSHCGAMGHTTSQPLIDAV